MTKPTITGGWGFMTDAEATTQKAYGAASSYAWTEVESGLTSALTTNGDIFTITGTTDDVGADEWASYAYPDVAHGAGETNLGISGTTYKKVVCRYKTSHALNAGLAFSLEVVYSNGTTEFAIQDQASTTWTTTIATLANSTGKNIDHVRIYANDVPNTIANGTYYVYVDFVLICNANYAIPRVTPGGIRRRSSVRWVDIPIPSRTTDISQNLGQGNTEIEITGEYDTNASWYSLSTTPGEIFYWLTHESDVNPWQWFTSNKYTGKVTIRDFDDGQLSDGTTLGPWRLLLKEYRLLSPASETVTERYGLT